LGGGTGLWSIRLAQQGYSTILTDISRGVLDRAKENIKKKGLSARITVEQADICDLKKYKAHSFPVILALGDPLSYCGNAKKALNEIKRISKPGGILIGDVENRYKIFDGRRASSWKDAKRILEKGTAFWPDSKSPAPIHQFTPSELKSLLAGTGWKTIDMYPSNLVWSLISSELIQHEIRSKKVVKEMIGLEEKLREDKHLLGCGFEIQFVAINSKK
jgi:SAM-dependent methyltransferase